MSASALLQAFTDAAADRLVRSIVEFRQETGREKELRDAQFAARMAELETRISAVSELERRLADRLATLKDGEPGRSVTVDELTPVIASEVSRAVGALPAPEPGKPGTSVTVEDVEPIIVKHIREAVEAIELPDVEAMIRQAVSDIPPAEPGKPGTSVTVEDVEPIIVKHIREAVEAIELPDVEAMIRQAVSDIPPAEPGKPGTSVTVEDVEPLVLACVAEAVAAIPPVEPREVDPELVQELIQRAVSALPPVEPKGVDPVHLEEMVCSETERVLSTWERPKDGLSVTEDQVQPMIEEQVRLAFASVPVPRDGEDADMEEISRQISALVEEAVAAIPTVEIDMEAVRTQIEQLVAALPPAPPGKDADPEVMSAMIEEAVRTAVEALPPPLKGDPGPMGKLPVVRSWEDRVYYEGEVCEFEGGSFQAQRDTGKSPLHADWTCIVRAGRDGEDGASLNPTGLYEAEKTYARLDVAMLNGASFVAKRDDPGMCPGDGWYLLAAQGKQGKPGLKGNPGVGLRGLPGPSVASIEVNDEGLLTVRNGDGSEITCDFYPLLSRLG
ncbi:hypothetical protein [Mesorhizobium amorphae]